MNRTLTRRDGLGLAAVVLAVLLVYGASLNNGFVWDDAPIIVDNEAAHHLESLATVFAAEDIAFGDEDNPYFRPLPRALYVLEYQLYGARPFGYHVDSLLCHALACLLLVLFLSRLFGSRRLAVGAALLFAIHPVNVEAVAFVSTRNTILAALFLLAALLVHHRWLTTGRLLLLLPLGLFAFAAFASKETALTLPLLLPVVACYDQGGGASRWRRAAAAMGVVAAVAALYLVMRGHALGGGGADLRLDHLGERLAAGLYIVPRYVENLLFPARLSALYALPDPLFSSVGVGVAVWVALAAGALLLARAGGAAAFGLLWFGINLLPVLNLVPIPSAPMADRYLYLPAIGAAVAASDLFRRGLDRLARGLAHRGVAVAGTLCLCLLGVTAAARTGVWHDDFRLYTSMAEPGGKQGFAYFNLGLVHRERGDLAAARDAWERAVAVEPTHALALTQLGNLAQMAGELEAAAAYYRRALTLRPELPEALFNCALALERQGDRAAARTLFARFVAVAPASYGAARAAAQGRLAGDGGSAEGAK